MSSETKITKLVWVSFSPYVYARVKLVILGRSMDTEAEGGNLEVPAGWRCIPKQIQTKQPVM